MIFLHVTAKHRAELKMDEGVGEMQNLCVSEAGSIKHERASESQVDDQELWFF